MNELIQRPNSLSGNVVMLCRYLRTKGYKISTSEEKDVLIAFKYLPPLSEDNFMYTLQSLLCKNHYQFVHFKDHYKTFYFELEKAVDSKKKDVSRPNTDLKKAKTPDLEALKNWLYNKPSDKEVEIPAYSNLEALTTKDFSEMTDDEVAYILRLLEKLSKRIFRKKSRLSKLSKKKKHLDMLRTLRHNFRSGTAINHFVFSEKKEKKLKLVLLCDVSRSMDLYSRFFIQMIYAFQKGYDQIETFVFSTSLNRITDILNNHDFDAAFEIIAERIPQWSGGTKIGFSLEYFNDNYAHKLINSKTVVLILSDGWDTGDTNRMKSSMKSLQQKARKIIWLNPLAGSPKFSPEVMGLKEVLPYIDKLYAAHNLSSLKKVLYQL